MFVDLNSVCGQVCVISAYSRLMHNLNFKFPLGLELVAERQAPNFKQITMTENSNSKQYDLEERTFKFSVKCRDFTLQLLKDFINIEYGKQLIRSSGSVAANYIEANEALSKKDFLHRIKICRKEAKESRLWLKLCRFSSKENLEDIQKSLIQEATELTKIFSAILNK